MTGLFGAGSLPEKLPRIMAAPNGARKQKSDHPAIPITIAQTVEVAKSCWQAGATALHFHLRDDDGAHILDAGLYREGLAELAQAVPVEAVQRAQVHVQQDRVPDEEDHGDEEEVPIVDEGVLAPGSAQVESGAPELVVVLAGPGGGHQTEGAGHRGGRR